jgi:hypothetical protein
MPKAKYTFTIVRPTYSDSISLPTFGYNSSNSIQWTAPASTPTGFTFNSTTPNISVTSSLAAGEVTIPFELRHSLVSNKKIEGELVIKTTP